MMMAKNNQGKKVQLMGLVRSILGLKLKTAKESLMELMNPVMEIMLLEKIMKNPVPMKILIMGGTLTRLIKELTVMRGVIWRLLVMKDKNMMSQLKKKEQRMMEMMKNQGKMVELREPIKLNPVAIEMLMAEKNHQGKTVQLRGVVRSILVLKLKTAKETLMELINAVMEIMSMEKIVKKPVPMKIIIMVGAVMRLIKEMTVTSRVIWRLVVMKDKQMMS
jgi:hypothetical protein